MNMYIVRDQNGVFVAGFNRQHQIVQRTTVMAYTKMFKTHKAATTWAQGKANAGYGLADFTVEHITSETFKKH